MTFLQAAERVLKESKRPMRPDEIVKAAIDQFSPTTSIKVI